jgi:P-aminobenzoate N-oxygenase AurF
VILVAEEILDALQREIIKDENVQPLIRRVCRIHVTEEARHVSYAQDELERQWRALSAPRRAQVRLNIAHSASMISKQLVHPDCYAAVGLSPRAATSAVRASPYWHENLAWAATKAVRFFERLHVIDPLTRPIWRRAYLIP